MDRYLDSLFDPVLSDGNIVSSDKYSQHTVLLLSDLDVTAISF